MIETARLDKWERDCLRFDPLEGDRDVKRKTIRDGFLVTRAAHVCSMCCGDIRPGLNVRAITETCDGEIGSFHYCPDCCRAMSSVIGDSNDDAPLQERYRLGYERCIRAERRRERAPVPQPSTGGEGER